MNIDLIIEQGKYSTWGRLNYEGNLIVEEAGSEKEIISTMKNLLEAFHGLNPDEIIFTIKRE